LIYKGFFNMDKPKGVLVLARAIGEVVSIGNRVEIQVMEIKGGNVRLGVTAPPDILIEGRIAQPVAIFTRRENEIIRVGKDIRILVVNTIGSAKVRLGFIAPRSVAVDRKEIREAKLKKNQT